MRGQTLFWVHYKLVIELLKHSHFLTNYQKPQILASHNNLSKYFFRHAKGKSMVNFYIVNALGQNLANSESYPILRLLKEDKICTFG